MRLGLTARLRIILGWKASGFGVADAMCGFPVIGGARLGLGPFGFLVIGKLIGMDMFGWKVVGDKKSLITNLDAGSGKGRPLCRPTY
jgi:hypothetical protein